MSELVASIMPHAVAVALSPLPIAALILILLSNKAKINSLSFLLGWAVALILNVGIVALIFNQPLPANDKSTAASLISGGLGLFLIFLALKQWHQRPKPGEAPKVPKWMNLIENFSPIQSFGLALMLVTVNAKNTVLDIAVGVIIGQKASTFSEGLITVLIFTAVSSFTIAIPVIAYFIYGDHLSGFFTKLKTWFIDNSATILFVLFLILGVNLLSKAFGG